MPRLRNAATEAVVSVPEEKVARLGPDWGPVDDAKKAPTKKAVSKPDAK